jgi:thioredoxin 1
MESLIAHLARKERDRLRVTVVDVDEQPDVAQRFGVATVPTLVLVKDRRTVARLEGRASAPKIDAMLAAQIPASAETESAEPEAA